MPSTTAPAAIPAIRSRRQPHTVSAILTGDFNLRARRPAARADDALRSTTRACRPSSTPGSSCIPASAQPPTIGVHDCDQWPDPFACDFIFATGDLRPAPARASRSTRRRRRATTSRCSSSSASAGASRAGDRHERFSAASSSRSRPGSRAAAGRRARSSSAAAPRCRSLRSCRRSSVAKPHRPPKMNTRPIPSTGEALPVIGCGTYVGFDHAPGSAEYAAAARRRRARCSTPAARCSTARRCTAAPRRRPASCSPRAAGAPRPSSPPRSGPRAAPKACARWRRRCACCAPTAIDLMQIHNLLDWRTHLATLRGWKDAGPHPLPRHHPLHVVGLRRGRGGAARREARLPADQLRARRSRRRAARCCRSPPSAASP